MELQPILNLANRVINGGKSRFGFEFAAITAARLTQGECESLFGDRKAVVRKVAIVRNGFLGRNYERCVQRRQDGEHPAYEAEKPSGMHWMRGFEDVVLEGDRDPSKHYLRVAFDRMSSTRTAYIVNGREATREEADAIRRVLAAKAKPCAKQAAAGVADEDEVVVRSYSTDNIVSIKVDAWQIAEGLAERAILETLLAKED